MHILRVIGRTVIGILANVGRVVIFARHGVAGCLSPPWYARRILEQIRIVGIGSLPIVGLTALFTGMVLALQSYTGFSRFNAENTIAAIVVLSITRELGPVLAGLMVAGRVGSAFAAEIGTMRVTEQIDALKTLNVDPVRFLVAPRLIATTLCLPLMVLVADIIGVMGGYAIATYKLDFNPGVYLAETFSILRTMDVVSGLIKAAIFGFVIALMGCYHGFHSTRGAEGVGLATTRAVVTSSLLILVFNYLVTEILFVE